MSYPNYQLCYRQNPYVQHQGYGNYPFFYGGGYAGGYAPGYAGGYAGRNYSSPNVFSIVKADLGDAVYALNNYDTLTLKSSNPDNLVITGDKTNKKVSFELKNLVTSFSGDSSAAGLARASLASRTSGFVDLSGTSAVQTLGDVRLAATGTLDTRVLLTAQGASSGTKGDVTITLAAGSFTIVSSSANDVRRFSYLLVN